MSDMDTGQIPVPQEIKIKKDDRQTILTKEWFYHPGPKDNYYTIRTSHVQPLICGENTMPTILHVLQSATKTIDIGLWCFDPALCLKGYNPALNSSYNLLDSLIPPLNVSPRVGDILLSAAHRGVKVRLLIWTLGDLIYNPIHWRELETQIGPILKSLKSSEWDMYWQLIKHYTGLSDKHLYMSVGGVLIFCLVVHIVGAIQTTILARHIIHKYINEFLKNNPNFLSNVAYRLSWYESLKNVSNIQIRTVGKDITPELVHEFLTGIIHKASGNDPDDLLYDEHNFLEKEYLKLLTLKTVNTHHQKCILVDHGYANATGLVMGNNLKMVDYDKLSHPAISGEFGGRFPSEVPRQDISTFIRGEVLDDVRDNYERIWPGAKPSFACTEGGELNKPTWIQNIMEKYKDQFRGVCEPIPLNKKAYIFNMKEVIAERKKSIEILAENSNFAQGHCQLSTTLIGHEGTESYIAKAHKTAINCCTSFVYFENQYFRYPKIAQALKERAKIRKNGQHNQDMEPLYYFTVINNVEPFAFQTTYDMLEELGHTGQMPAEAHKEYGKYIKEQEHLQESISYLEKRLNSPHTALALYEYKEKLRQTNQKIEELEKKYPQIEPGKKTLPRKAEEIESAGQAFKIEEDESLKGHIAILLVSHPVKKKVLNTYVNPVGVPYTLWDEETHYEYIPVNIHTKSMIVDDVFIIIGSANMHERGMEWDNEIDISTTRPGVALETRKTLFAAYTNNNQKIISEEYTWGEIYDQWKYFLDINWRNHFYQKNLEGKLFYFYSPTVNSSLITLD